MPFSACGSTNPNMTPSLNLSKLCPSPVLDYRASSFIDAALPDWRTLRRLRHQACPYLGCTFYTIVYEILPTGQAGDALANWEGNVLDCPSTWWWEDAVPWCWFTTTYLITPTGSNQAWTVDPTWNSANNTVSVIGGGGAGSSHTATNETTGGGGGAYSHVTNLTLTPSGSATYQVGIGGVPAINVTGGNGGATWFNGTTQSGSSVGAGGGTVGADGGGGGPGGTATPGTGSSGGAGGTNVDAAYSSSGGGGAGGPNGVGAVGGTITIGNPPDASSVGGLGGGGNGGGTIGVGTSVDIIAGTAGGNNSSGSGSGAGGASTPAAGSSGTSGGGGGGGGGSTTAGVTCGAGGAGGTGIEFDASHGSGGGGGGGGSNNQSTGTAGLGGTGGLYGGGSGGGGGNSATNQLAGTGGQGIINLTWVAIVNFMWFPDALPYHILKKNKIVDF
jgi:hypothetical protein